MRRVAELGALSLHRAMKQLLAFLAAALFGSWTAQAESTNNVTTNDVVRLRVTVMDSVPLRSFHGSVTPISDVDPRFALTVRIDSCVPAVTNLKSGTVVTFAVHSPSLFLRGSAEKGKTHEITMPRKKAMNLQGEQAKGAAANRRPALESDGAENLSAIVAAARAFPAAVVELDR
jgi:hypothetical protein